MYTHTRKGDHFGCWLYFFPWDNQNKANVCARVSLNQKLQSLLEETRGFQSSLNVLLFLLLLQSSSELQAQGYSLQHDKLTK